MSSKLVGVVELEWDEYLRVHTFVACSIEPLPLLLQRIDFATDDEGIDTRALVSMMKASRPLPVRSRPGLSLIEDE